MTSGRHGAGRLGTGHRTAGAGDRTSTDHRRRPDRPDRDSPHRGREMGGRRRREGRPQEGAGPLSRHAASGTARQLGDRRPSHHLRTAVLRRRQARGRRPDRRHDAGRALRLSGDRSGDRVAERLPGDRHHRSVRRHADPDVVSSEVHRTRAHHHLLRARHRGDRWPGQRSNDQLRPTTRRGRLQ